MQGNCDVIRLPFFLTSATTRPKCCSKYKGTPTFTLPMHTSLHILRMIRPKSVQK